MAKVFGTITPSAGIGVKSVNLGVSGITRFRIEGAMTGTGYIAEAVGVWDSGTQRYRSNTEGVGSYAPSATFDIVNSSGTVVYRASCTGISGTTMSWNVTTATITPTLMIEGDDQT